MVKPGVSQSPVQSDDVVNIRPSRAGVLHHDGRVKESAFSLGLWTLRLPTEGAVHHVSPTWAVVPHAAAPRSQEAAGGEERWPGRGGCGGDGGAGRGGVGGVFLELFFGPCGHAATCSVCALI